MGASFPSQLEVNRIGAAVSHENITVATKDGNCPVHIFRPDGNEPLPAVIFYMDVFGARPALFSMCERLAEAGYLVALPDIFYRAGSYAIYPPADVFASQELQAEMFALMGTTDPQRVSDDTGSILDYLASRSDVAGSKVGTTGYCFGGGMSLSVAGSHPDRIAVAASFHAGGVVLDTPLSPHVFARNAKGFLLVVGADNDEHYPPEMADALERVLTEANVPHRCEIFEGAMHGFAVPDVPTFNEEASERHWSVLLDLLKGLPRS
jgi:carboxymethylenebutenolidase